MSFMKKIKRIQNKTWEEPLELDIILSVLPTVLNEVICGLWALTPFLPYTYGIAMSHCGKQYYNRIEKVSVTCYSWNPISATRRLQNLYKHRIMYTVFLWNTFILGYLSWGLFVGMMPDILTIWAGPTNTLF